MTRIAIGGILTECNHLGGVPIDLATYDEPDRFSEGIPYVLVAGTFVVIDGVIVDGVTPGQAIRGVSLDAIPD